MGNNPLNLVIAAKYLAKTDPFLSGVVEIFANNYELLKTCPLDYSDNPTRYDWKREKFIADASWRELNYDVDNTHSELEDAVAYLYPLATKIVIDNALKKGKSENLIKLQIMGATKGMASKLTKSFFSGDNSISSNEPDGLNVMLANYSQAGAIATNGLNVLGSAANAKILIQKMNEMISYVDEPTTAGQKMWVMGLDTKLKLDDAINLSGLFLNTNDRSTIIDPKLGSFGGIPILTIGKDKDGSDILGFSETEGTSTGVCASIYLINFAVDDGVHFATPSGEVNVLSPTWSERSLGYGTEYFFELSMGIVMKKARAAYRLTGIKKA
jgi:hypothetical protein